jgi:tetratricopeptide (TPR) repeat protein
MAVPSKFDVFLSHNGADKPAVEELARRLKREGIEPWLDRWNLIPGDHWQPAIESALADCSSCAVFIGPRGLGSWHNEEMRAAIDRRVTGGPRRFRVIPVLLPGADRPERSGLPTFLVAATWVEFRRTLDDDDAVHRLICGIRGLEPGQGPGGAIMEGECPYRGLEHFDEGHARFFFGREALTEWLLDALRPSTPSGRENRFLAVIGPSGSGKSSLALAGLVPALRAGRLEGSETWPIAVLRPGYDPPESLAVRLSGLGGETPNPAGVRQLMRDLAEDPRSLHLAVRLALRDAPPGRRVVILVDQFEEAFTLCRDEAPRRALIDNLLYAASVAGGRAIVVLTMRADFYGKCAAFPVLAAALSDHQMLVGPLTGDELRRAIERPAQLVGCEFEPGLVERLLNDVRDQPGALPLLQFALMELWGRREGRRLTLAAYKASGELRGALENRADEILRGFSDSEKELCRRIFLRLTQPGEGTEDTKRRAPLLELASAGGDADALGKVLRELADARLITTQGDGRPDEAGYVEVAHEALIRGWGELRRWIDADRTGLRTQRRLTDAARDWAEGGRDPSDLYTGARLAVAQEWAEAHSGELNTLEAEFLAAGADWQHRRESDELEAARRMAALAEARRQAEEERALESERREKVAEGKAAQERRARRLTVALAGSILLAFLSIGGGVWWFERREEARLSRTSSRAEGDLGEAARLADEARAKSDLSLWDAAVAATKQAVGVLDSGGGNPRLRRRAEAVLAGLTMGRDQARKDISTRARLDEARLLASGMKEEKYDFGSMIDEYRRAFREYGIDVVSLPRPQAVSRINSSRIREALAAALDDWAAHSNESDAPLLRDLAHEADPDPHRDAVREALVKKDAASLRRLAHEPGVADLPKVTLVRLGDALRNVREGDEALTLLQRAHRVHPDDFWINQALAEASSDTKPPLYDATVRYYTAALAIRPNSPGTHSSLGIALANRGDLDEAVTECREAIRLNPGSARAHNSLGQVLKYQGKLQDAIAAYREAIRLNPGYAVSHKNLGSLLSSAGDFDGAAAEFREVIRLRKSRWENGYQAEAYNSLGRALRSKGDIGGAIDAFRQAIANFTSRPPTDSDELVALGDARWLTGDLKGAIAEYREAIRRDPGDATAHHSLGNGLRSQGDLDGALAEFRESTRLAPAYATSHTRIGGVLSAKGDLDGAIAEYHAALRTRPGDADAHNRLGYALWGKGGLDDAIAEFRKSISISPGYAAAHNNLGEALGNKGDRDGAIAEYREAIRLEPTDAGARINLIEALEDKGDREGELAEAGKATVIFREAVRLDPNDSEAHRVLGHGLFHQGDRDGAIAEYREAIRLSPGFASTHLDLGSSLMKNGDREAAIVAFKEAIRLSPGDADALAKYGGAIYQGDSAGAIASFREAIRRRPGYAGAHNSLGHALYQKHDYDGAIAELKEGIRLYPGLAWPHDVLGLALKSKGEGTRAIAEFKEAIRLDPAYPKAYKNLADLISSQGNLDEARALRSSVLAAYREATRRRPDDAEAHLDLGDVLRKRDDHDGAIAAYREAIRLKPDDEKARQRLIRELNEKGERDGVIAIHREVIRRRPDDPEGHINLADELLDRGDVDGAIAEYRDAHRLRPDDEKAREKLFSALDRKKDYDGMIALLREAIRRHPDAFDFHRRLGGVLFSKGDLDGATPEYKEAIRLNADDAMARTYLGKTLQRKGDLNGAIAEYREAIRHRPGYLDAHFNFGEALRLKGDLDGAIATHRAVVQVWPDSAQAHAGLGAALLVKRDVDAAIAELREAIRLQPDRAEPHVNLGFALAMKGDLDGAIPEFRAAILHRPEFAEAHIGLGDALLNKGDVDGSIPEYREGLRLNPSIALAHCNLSISLRRKGRFAEALDEAARGHELGSKLPGWNYPSDRWVSRCRRLVELDAKLPTVLRGEARPADDAEREGLADVCFNKGLQAASARLYAEVIATQPDRAADLSSSLRYNGACASALAGCGKGTDAPPPDEASKGRCRAQALDWLRADLSAWTKRLEEDPANSRAAILQSLRHWQVDPDLSCLRDEAELAKLPDEERKSWMALWSEVAALRGRAEGED